MFGEVLANGYSEASYGAVHELTVDAYAAQHPGQPSPQSIQSVAVHLVSLWHILEEGLPPLPGQCRQEAGRPKQARLRMAGAPHFAG